MSRLHSTADNTFAPAIEAVWNLLQEGFERFEHRAWSAGLTVHAEIESTPIGKRTSPFYRQLVPLRQELVGLLVEAYRRFFRLALARPKKTGSDPHAWASTQLQPALGIAIEYIREWYVLACDGENQSVRRVKSIAFVPGGQASIQIPSELPPSPHPTTWRAPAWLFQISIALVGVGPLKQHHIPKNGSEEKLSEAHTRLLMKGARRVFLWALEAAIETVRNEETAAAGAIPAEMAGGQTEGSGNKADSKSRLKGIEGLGPKKSDLSRYMHNLTKKQQLAFSLKYEYELGLGEIASRMEVDRKTAYEHIEAANRKVGQAHSNEKRKARSAKVVDE
jgi:hypothetical protein